MVSKRIEKDSMGEVQLPDGALYGAQTQRAVENFPISGWRMPKRFLYALARIKMAAAHVHKSADRLDEDKAVAIIGAAQEVLDGKHDTQFPVDVFQTGSGTSTNMNMNEVLANRACELLGGKPGDRALVHPNDHVNLGQSSNDVIPTAMYVATARAIHEDLIPALRDLHETLQAKAEEFRNVVKLARTHLMDAVPMTLGQECSGYAAMIEASLGDLQSAMTSLCELPLGGTAAGTGLNAPPDFASNVCLFLFEELTLPFAEARNHVAASSCRNIAVGASGALRRTALSLGKIASDLRLLGSGPRGGFGEINLPAVQPGSSIMPGKVNPVLCESVIQVACMVVGCDAAIAAGAMGGVGSILELNLAMPMLATNLLTEVDLLANVTRAFDAKCVAGITANPDRCRDLLDRSLAMVTALAPEIGYDKAADLARQAHESGKSIRAVCLEQDILPAETLDELLDPMTQTGQ